MADLASTGAAQHARLAHAVGREVVVEHEVLLLQRQLQAFQLLALARRSQGGRGQYLRLPSGENGRAVGARQEGDLGGNRTNVFDAAAIRALPLVQDQGAKLLLDHLIYRLAQLCLALGKVGCQIRDDLAAQELEAGFAGGLVWLLDRLADARRLALAHGVDQLGIDDEGWEIALGLARLGGQLFLSGDEGTDMLLGELQRREQILLGHLFRARLHHDDARLSSRDHQVEVTFLRLCPRGVDEELAIHPAYAHGGDQVGEGDVAHGKGSGSARDGEHIGRMVLIHGERHRYDLDFVPQAGGEEGANRAVDQAGCEDGKLARPALTLDASAGDPANGVHAFFKIACQGEEINALTGLLACGGRHQDHRITGADQHRSACLLGYATGFETYGRLTECCFHYGRHRLFSSPLSAQLPRLLEAQPGERRP